METKKIVVMYHHGDYQTEYQLSEKALQWITLNYPNSGVTKENIDSFPRDSEMIVKCVETLGCKACGMTEGTLGIATIPNNVEWEFGQFDEFDATENIVALGTYGDNQVSLEISKEWFHPLTSYHREIVRRINIKENNRKFELSTEAKKWIETHYPGTELEKLEFQRDSKALVECVKALGGKNVGTNGCEFLVDCYCVDDDWEIRFWDLDKYDGTVSEYVYCSWK